MDTISADQTQLTTPDPTSLEPINSRQVDFVTNRNQRIEVTNANTRIGLVALGLTFAYDSFRDKIIIRDPTGTEHNVTEQVILQLKMEICNRYGFEPSARMASECIHQLALLNQFDPIRDYLNGLQWDGVPRIDNWLTGYIGADDTPLHRAIGRKTMLALVRRARQPGCKFDQIIVFESEEGMYKSTMLATLAGHPDFFTDQTILQRGDREHQETLKGKWIIEFAELESLRNAEVTAIKAFASRQVDRVPSSVRTLCRGTATKVCLVCDHQRRILSEVADR
jgi:predicted P-loop ATPase